MQSCACNGGREAYISLWQMAAILVLACSASAPPVLAAAPPEASDHMSAQDI